MFYRILIPGEVDAEGPYRVEDLPHRLAGGGAQVWEVEVDELVVQRGRLVGTLTTEILVRWARECAERAADYASARSDAAEHARQADLAAEDAARAEDAEDAAAAAGWTATCAEEAARAAAAACAERAERAVGRTDAYAYAYAAWTAFEAGSEAGAEERVWQGGRLLELLAERAEP